ncbi:hypothetical protein PUN28_001199 [Cardiocondyla obscurior]|uniref:Uncharacterized protein n=1 Tax=Cardiocondyla obscurior TaxID=286306 RepID=A0AAW2H3S6_9HYME
MKPRPVEAEAEDGRLDSCWDRRSAFRDAVVTYFRRFLHLSQASSGERASAHNTRSRWTLAPFMLYDNCTAISAAYGTRMLCKIIVSRKMANNTVSVRAECFSREKNIRRHPWK